MQVIYVIKQMLENYIVFSFANESNKILVHSERKGTQLDTVCSIEKKYGLERFHYVFYKRIWEIILKVDEFL